MSVDVGIQNKQCAECRDIKLLSKFHKNKAKKDGYQACCKDCRKERQKK